MSLGTGHSKLKRRTWNKLQTGSWENLSIKTGTNFSFSFFDFWFTLVLWILWTQDIMTIKVVQVFFPKLDQVLKTTQQPGNDFHRHVWLYSVGLIRRMIIAIRRSKQDVLLLFVPFSLRNEPTLKIFAGRWIAAGLNSPKLRVIPAGESSKG